MIIRKLDLLLEFPLSIGNHNSFPHIARFKVMIDLFFLQVKYFINSRGLDFGQPSLLINYSEIDFYHDDILSVIEAGVIDKLNFVR
jgi:hypothetical protein